MSKFTHSLPFSKEKFLDGIFYQLKRENQYDVANLLKGCSVQIEEGGYSYYCGGSGRWNAYAVYVVFYVNPANIVILDTEETKRLLLKICDSLIPSDVGFDIKSVSFSLDLIKNFELEDDLILDLEKNANAILSKVIKDILPEDVKIIGYHMAEIYIYLYVVENSLRLFIEKVCRDNYGEDYFNKINVPRALTNTIQSRMKDAHSKKWLSIRGNELFYLDFKDLGSIINNNWDLFESFFPNQDFIIPKLNEMADCRNLIAHNSYVGDTERNLVKTYYNVILKQIADNHSI